MSGYTHPHALIREYTAGVLRARAAYHGEQEAAADRSPRDRAARHAAAQKRYRERNRK